MRTSLIAGAETFLSGVAPTDPLTLIAVGTVFGLVAMLACWAPTRRAGKVDPAGTETTVVYLLK